MWNAIKTFFFLWNPERAHRIALFFLRLTRNLGGNSALRILSGGDSKPSSRSIEVFGVSFLNRVGLAAGFDKNGEFIECLPALGFGFAELGTVTPRAQPGNPPPRLFRDPAKRALFNRMGFNNDGMEALASRIESAKPKLPAHFRIGVNLGKNKDTPIAEAHLDYAVVARRLGSLADYLVINVSSPNTEGLRSLQKPEALKRIIDSVRESLGQWGDKMPILVKLAPELDGHALDEIVSLESQVRFSGYVLTNTLLGEWKIKGEDPIKGGWSGEPLRVKSRQALMALRERTTLPVISVGGVMDAGEARMRLALGADLIQIYTGWIYKGPSFPWEIQKGEALVGSTERASQSK